LGIFEKPNGDDKMNVEKIIIIKLHSLGIYGSSGISIKSLKTGIKGDYTPQELENAILDAVIDLFKKDLIIISNSPGYPSISLNPRKKAEIDKFVR
jgi:hypothetical protein